MAGGKPFNWGQLSSALQGAAICCAAAAAALSGHQRLLAAIAATLCVAAAAFLSYSTTIWSHEQAGVVLDKAAAALAHGDHAAAAGALDIVHGKLVVAADAQGVAAADIVNAVRLSIGVLSTEAADLKSACSAMDLLRTIASNEAVCAAMAGGGGAGAAADGAGLALIKQLTRTVAKTIQQRCDGRGGDTVRLLSSGAVCLGALVQPERRRLACRNGNVADATGMRHVRMRVALAALQAWRLVLLPAPPAASPAHAGRRSPDRSHAATLSEEEVADACTWCAWAVMNALQPEDDLDVGEHAQAGARAGGLDASAAVVLAGLATSRNIGMRLLAWYAARAPDAVAADASGPSGSATSTGSQLPTLLHLAAHTLRLFSSVPEATASAGRAASLPAPSHPVHAFSPNAVPIKMALLLVALLLRVLLTVPAPAIADRRQPGAATSATAGDDDDDDDSDGGDGALRRAFAAADANLQRAGFAVDSEELMRRYLPQQLTGSGMTAATLQAVLAAHALDPHIQNAGKGLQRMLAMMGVVR